MSALLSANDLRLTYGYQTLLDGITLAIAAGEKVGLVGRNGCGKTSLLKILTAQQAADSGEISTRRQLRIGYLPQEFELDPALSVHENIAAGAADLVTAIRRYEAGDGSEAELVGLHHLIDHADGWNLDARIKATATALDAPPLEAPLSRLSGGEQRRVALCRALASQPDLLLLDEPTNHLDAESIQWLEEFLRSFAGAVIFVTHDRCFLDRICDQIVAFEDGGVVVQAGNYSYYLAKRREREARERAFAVAAAREAAARSKATAPPAAKPRQFTAAMQRELDAIEATIAAAEQDVAGLEALLNDPALHATRFGEVPAAVARLEAAKGQLSALYTRWEELETIKAAR